MLLEEFYGEGRQRLIHEGSPRRVGYAGQSHQALTILLDTCEDSTQKSPYLQKAILTFSVLSGYGKIRPSWEYVIYFLPLILL